MYTTLKQIQKLAIMSFKNSLNSPEFWNTMKKNELIDLAKDWDFTELDKKAVIKFIKEAAISKNMIGEKKNGKSEIDWKILEILDWNEELAEKLKENFLSLAESKRELNELKGAIIEWYKEALKGKTEVIVANLANARLVARALWADINSIFFPVKWKNDKYKVIINEVDKQKEKNGEKLFLKKDPNDTTKKIETTEATYEVEEKKTVNYSGSEQKRQEQTGKKLYKDNYTNNEVTMDNYEEVQHNGVKKYKNKENQMIVDLIPVQWETNEQKIDENWNKVFKVEKKQVDNEKVMEKVSEFSSINVIKENEFDSAEQAELIDKLTTSGEIDNKATKEILEVFEKGSDSAKTEINNTIKDAIKKDEWLRISWENINKLFSNENLSHIIEKAIKKFRENNNIEKSINYIIKKNQYGKFEVSRIAGKSDVEAKITEIEKGDEEENKRKLAILKKRVNGEEKNPTDIDGKKLEWDEKTKALEAIKLFKEINEKTEEKTDLENKIKENLEKIDDLQDYIDFNEDEEANQKIVEQKRKEKSDLEKKNEWLNKKMKIADKYIKQSEAIFEESDLPNSYKENYEALKKQQIKMNEGNSAEVLKNKREEEKTVDTAKEKLKKVPKELPNKNKLIEVAKELAELEIEKEKLEGLWKDTEEIKELILANEQEIEIKEKERDKLMAESQEKVDEGDIEDERWNKLNVDAIYKTYYDNAKTILELNPDSEDSYIEDLLDDSEEKNDEEPTEAASESNENSEKFPSELFNENGFVINENFSAKKVWLKQEFMQKAKIIAPYWKNKIMKLVQVDTSYGNQTRAWEIIFNQSIEEAKKLLETDWTINTDKITTKKDITNIQRLILLDNPNSLPNHWADWDFWPETENAIKAYNKSKES